MIAISNLEFRYRGSDFRLRVPELSIARGESVAIIGPSGTGKTTLLNLIAGVSQPEAGTIVTNDIDVSRLNEAQRRDFRVRNIGMVFQEFELLPHLNVLDNILLPYRITPALRLSAEVRERAVELARRVGIDTKRNRNVERLSQGERQRVAVCRALLTAPALLLADEPTGNLDPANKGRVLDILFEFAGETGATFLTVTHDHDLLDRFDRVLEFDKFHGQDNTGGEVERD
ncbi:MAG: ABC transporter ATP-binding protein [Candidatus Krumholzibacteriota bacterium]|nr:ABC transporter ATP-binding protein [Candidatus Krumholzibacteriota bacterium]